MLKILLEHRMGIFKNYFVASPNSLDCVWTISASSGHRIKFTVDPISFNLDDNSMEDAMYIDQRFLNLTENIQSSLPKTPRSSFRNWCFDRTKRKLEEDETSNSIK